MLFRLGEEEDFPIRQGKATSGKSGPHLRPERAKVGFGEVCGGPEGREVLRSVDPDQRRDLLVDSRDTAGVIALRRPCLSHDGLIGRARAVSEKKQGGKRHHCDDRDQNNDDHHRNLLCVCLLRCIHGAHLCNQTKDGHDCVGQTSEGVRRPATGRH